MTLVEFIKVNRYYQSLLPILFGRLAPSAILYMNLFHSNFASSMLAYLGRHVLCQTHFLLCNCSPRHNNNNPFVK
jgi:hypothetical protein